MTLLGNFALLLGLISAGYAVVVGVAGARSGREEPIRSAEGAMKAAAVSLSVAALALIVLLLRKDFRVEYVAQYTSRDLSVFYTVGAFWAGQAGSLLLWGWTLSLIGAGVIFQNRARNRDLMPWVTVTLGVVLAFFVVLVTFYANPFRTLPVAPSDGQGLNPLLQNYGQWVHPIALYLGFVGFTVPFAFAVAALATGRLGDRWIRSVRRWTLWAWVLLTAGILFGARWAYVELGWGGYWAWDPVENASLLPWLVGTAYLHSVVVQEKRGMLRVWNVSLAVAAFAMSIFGTFLTRSGVISSVHAFAESSMGPLLIGFTFVTIAVGTALIVWRLPQLRASGRITSVVSREASFLLTNLLFVGMTIVVLWGTIYPIVSEAVRGVEISVGQPFFNALMAPLAIVTVALVGTCPLLPWRRASNRHLKRNLAMPLAVGAVVFLALGLANRGDDLLIVTVLALGAFVLATVTAEISRGLSARHRHHGESWPRAILNLFAFTPRRYGGPIIHAGVVIMLAGIFFNIGMKQEVQSQLAVGESVRIAGNTVTFEDLTFEQTPSKFALIGSFRVVGPGGEDLGTIVTEQAEYTGQQQVTEVGMRSTLGADLYVVMSNVDPTQRVATVLVFHEPAVFWIWTGMIVIVVGGILAAWPWRTDRAARGGRGELEIPSEFEEPEVAR
ncbi:MAG TPA: heme lyase CcmF/NrfE family subunit [Actinomycetota bacterium]|nr:heme lyase CcmF/NrfE family subunit [Actinomycetota bacterium]